MDTSFGNVTTYLIFTLGKIADEDFGEKWDDRNMGVTTHVPRKGETVRIDGRVYGVTKVHYNVDSSDATPIMYAFVHLGLAAED